MKISRHGLVSRPLLVFFFREIPEVIYKMATGSSGSFFKSLLKFRTFAIVFALCAMPQFLMASSDGEAPDMTHRMMTLVIQLGIILFAARAGGKLFEKLGLPSVLGELCTGIIIGPSLLGGIAILGFPHGIFYLSDFVKCGSTAVSPELYGICTLASIVLLFLVGVETDLKLLFRYAAAGGLVGIGGVLVAFVGGDLLGMYLLPMLDASKTYTFFDPACIFLGVMSTATSVSITARILSEKHKLDTPEGVTILAGAVIDDVLGIILLAIAMGIAESSSAGASEGVNWGKIGVVAVRAFGVWLGATIVGLVLSHYISRFLKKCFQDATQIATMALGFAMIVAGLFEEAGLAMIIGAYVLGLSLSRTDIAHVVQEHLHPIYLFVVPVFFVVMGMLVDIKQMTDPKVLIFGGIYTFVAIITKIVGCGFPTFLCGFNARGALRVGLGMIPRGEVALIVAGLGLSKGLIDDTIFGVAVMMTLITTLIPPPLIVESFKSPASGVRANKRKEEVKTPDIVFSFDSPEATRLVLNSLIEAFTQEGFFVHTFNAKDGVYQVLKDTKVIHISVDLKKNTVTFECTDDEASFVNTVMREVIADLEHLVRALRQPLEDTDIVAQLENNDAAAVKKQGRNARMRRYLKEAAMIPDLKVASKEEAIRKLITVLAEQKIVKDATAVYNAVMEREESMSTGLSHGFACPHARTGEVSDLVCIIALVPDGVDFKSIDGEPTHVIQLILSPVDQPAPYMEFMASMSTIYTGDGREALLMCKTAKDMYKELCYRLK